MDDQELFEQLRRGPLNRNGFDETLRRRINERLDHPKRHPPRLWLLRLRGVSTVALLFLIVATGFWVWKEMPLGNTRDLPLAKQSPAQLEGLASEAAVVEEAPKSAMLIGLRKDEQTSRKEVTISSYRTVLVVPEENELTVAASGEGIWMPYGTKFWKIDAVEDTQGLGIQTMVSASVDNLDKFTLMELPEQLRRTEKLLYVSNKYVAVEQTTFADLKGQSVNNSSIFVDEVKQLQRFPDTTRYLKVPSIHLTLDEVLKEDAAGYNGGEWTIARHRGKWVAKQPASPTKLNAAATASVTDVMELIPAALNETVTSHDTLTLTWDQISEMHPDAKDAFMSPTDDILAVVTQGGIVIYPYKLEQERMKPLTVPTEANETIVMVQWAKEENNYINIWKDVLGKLIPPA